MANVHDTVQYLSDFTESILINGAPLINNYEVTDNLIRNYWGIPATGSVPSSSFIINWSDIDSLMSSAAYSDNDGIAVKVENIATPRPKISIKLYKVTRDRNNMIRETSAITYFIITKKSLKDNVYFDGKGTSRAEDDTTFNGLLHGLDVSSKRDKIFSLQLGKSSATPFIYYLIVQILNIVPFEGGGGDGFAAGAKIPSN